MMIGYRSVQHQGFAMAKLAEARGDKLAADQHNPYPLRCQAFYEYQDGCGAFRAGKIIDRRGNIAEGEVSRRRIANEENFRHGAAW